MRERAVQPDQDSIASGRLPVMRERSDTSLVLAAMDLQKRAGNRSVAALVEGSRADRDLGPLAALSRAGHTPASMGAAAGSGSLASVQREPCTDCPEAAQRAKLADAEAALDPGQAG